MTDQSAAVAGTVPVPEARLEPNAIGVAQDTVIGMASSAPAASVGLTLAAPRSSRSASWPSSTRCRSWACKAWSRRPSCRPTRRPRWLVYVAQAIGGGFWAKTMALPLALSVIATTGTGIVLTARIVYGMASYRALPGFLATISRRFATPVAASVLVGLLIVGLTWVYMLATSVENAFNDVVAVTGLIFAIFYILTALATIVYYRGRVFTRARDAVLLGVLPLAAAGFLGWLFVKSLQAAAAAQVCRWSASSWSACCTCSPPGSCCDPRSSIPSERATRGQAEADAEPG